MIVEELRWVCSEHGTVDTRTRDNTDPRPDRCPVCGAAVHFEHTTRSGAQVN
jgi:hypothetical protein